MSPEPLSDEELDSMEAWLAEWGSSTPRDSERLLASYRATRTALRQLADAGCTALTQCEYAHAGLHEALRAAQGVLVSDASTQDATR